ncbi:RidA family protein [Sphingosinicella rhizophila]|uniref:RidA family protein n=1 Tax=Sphingosinicella rhizophila TaxID=3050082 RepID=A0ABU3Q9E8_9SPHN|nr:RidA family protein [Sphingosinicella sp. GR2756]MDT9599937.1 RidA family protein [Sphingosinicella sp. GR2756]
MTDHDEEQSHVIERLGELGLTLPVPSRPAANYRPYRLAGTMLHIAGQLPLVHNVPKYVGEVPTTLTIEDAIDAARLCALNLTAQIGAALDGEFGRVEAILKINGFIRSPAEFTSHARIMDGASDLLAALFGLRGAHARTSVGVASLPRGAPIELDAIVAVRA